MAFSKHNKLYVSDYTRFLSEMKQKDPSLDEKQRNGRLIHWDKAPIDLDARRRTEESRIKQQAYVYQTKH
ncbi:DUF3460 family protein [Noviherbaspirillum sp.]|jgi:hypothetical protein|uniref:DUF3460 family protein n=1 Tax=Noviherbaspirillum sp. TaxID=1926288 RepID=UPI0025EA8199|nr:DUF3460 family protein [Noviherbaspirillum sp.]